MDDALSRLGGRVRELRALRGWSQRDLSRRLLWQDGKKPGRSVNGFLSRMEHGKEDPSPGYVERLARAFGISVKGLLAPNDLSELAADAFIAEMVPYLGRLDYNSWRRVLESIRGISLRNSGN